MLFPKAVRLGLLCIGLVGCGQSTPKRSSSKVATPSDEKSSGTEKTSGEQGGEGSGFEDVSEVTIRLDSLQKVPDEDVVDFTMGVVRAEVRTEVAGNELAADIVGTAAEIIVNRFALVGGKDAFNTESFTNDERELVATYCGSTFVSASPEFSNAKTTSRDTILGVEEIYVGWRAYHPNANKEALGNLRLKHGTGVLCAIDVSLMVAGQKIGKGFSVVFNPAPSPLDEYAGTDKSTDAIDAVVMLPFAWEGNRPAGKWDQIPIPSSVLDKDTSLKRRIPALKVDAIAYSMETDATSPCEIRQVATTKAALPQSTQTVRTKVDTFYEANISIVGIESRGAGGVGMPHPACSALSHVSSDDESAVSTELTCEQVAAIVDATVVCGIDVEIANADDPANSVNLKASLIGYSYEVSDLTDAPGAVSVLPEVASNPIRSGTVLSPNFSTTQRDALTRAFDLWQTVSPATYEALFEGHITQISFDNNNAPGQFCETAGAYALLNSNQFFWCIGGAMNANWLTPEQSPYAIIYRALTAMHETIHTLGKLHDKDAPAYPSCTSAGGTSYSAQIAVDVFRCDEDYCFGLKESAVEMFESELNYSLEGDARRFSGVCSQLAAELGVSFQ